MAAGAGVKEAQAALAMDSTRVSLGSMTTRGDDGAVVAVTVESTVGQASSPNTEPSQAAGAPGHAAALTSKASHISSEVRMTEKFIETTSDTTRD